MSQDGAIEYRRYTTVELREALSTIDRTKFPLNFAALGMELATRPEPHRQSNQLTNELAPTVMQPAQPKVPHGKRPVLVWVLLAFYAIGVFAGGPIFYAVTTGALDLPGPIGSHFRAFGFWDFVRVGISYVLMASVMIALFRMKRITLNLALVAWAYGVLVEIFEYQELSALGLTAISMVIGNILGLLIVFYFWRLSQTSRLS